MNYPQYETLHYHSWSERQERTPEDNICYHAMQQDMQAHPCRIQQHF